MPNSVIIEQRTSYQNLPAGNWLGRLPRTLGTSGLGVVPIHYKDQRQRSIFASQSETPFKAAAKCGVSV